MEKTDDHENAVRATLRGLMSKSEDLLAAFEEEGAQRHSDATTALERRIRRARDPVNDLHYFAVCHERLAARRADDHVHENPWATAVGSAVGALVALLLMHSDASRGDANRGTPMTGPRPVIAPNAGGAAGMP